MATHKRDSIVAAGAKLILKKGYAAAGLAELVRSAGIPKGSFYHFFPGGKDEFVLAVVERYVEIATRARHESLADDSGSAFERLRSHFQSMGDAFAAGQWSHGCLLGNLVAEAADEFKALRIRIRAAFELWVEDVARVLAEGEHDGSLVLPGSVTETARGLVGGWEGAVLLMKSRHDAAPIEDFVTLWFGSSSRPGILTNER